jgi:hypothetical protein
MKSLLYLLLPAVALVSGCDRRGYSQNTSERYTIEKVEVGLSQIDGEDTATLVIFCLDHTFHFTSRDISQPSDILDRFKQVLPIAADFKARGQSSCQLEVTFSQYHSMSINDKSNAPQKQAWFRFAPNTNLCQGFSVTDFATGLPSSFTSRFTQDLDIPLVIKDEHWIQTKPTSKP